MKTTKIIVALYEYCLFFFPQANHYYKLYITWTSQKIKKTFVHRNMFDFKHIKVSCGTQSSLW